VSEARYALYAVPRPETALARFGAAWLGWDIEKGECVEAVKRAGLPVELHRAITAEPRRYGFHGTLKAPFRLVEGTSETELIAAVAEFAARREQLAPIPLRLATLGGFIALIPAESAPALHGLAASAVEELDRFRAPLTESELARRNKAPLTLPQQALLQRWGYPYVMDQFRYHMTLTGSLEPDTRAQAMNSLGPAVVPLIVKPYLLDDVALCVEPVSDAGFRVLRRFGLEPVPH